jgi:hypothetical protein
MTRLPGTRLLAALRHWCDPATVANIFEPLIADWQHEWLAAATHRERIKARVIGCVAALSVIAQIAPGWIVTLPPRSLAGPVLARALSFGLVASAVLMYPFAVSYWRIARWDAWFYLLPSAVAIPLSNIALPLAHRLREVSDENDHRARQLLAQSIAVLTIASALTVGWIMPIANQQWRTAIFAMLSKNPNAAAPVKGIRELTIPQLLSEPTQSPRYEFVRREIHSRASLALSPITFGAIGWMLWRPRRTRAVVVFLAWVTGGVSFYQLSVIGRGAEDAYSLFAGAGFWLAHLLVLLGLTLYSCTRHGAPTVAPGTRHLAP